jgi:hypothetical protein
MATSIRTNQGEARMASSRLRGADRPVARRVDGERNTEVPAASTPGLAVAGFEVSTGRAADCSSDRDAGKKAPSGTAASEAGHAKRTAP